MLTDRILRAKHWQLFLLFCGIPLTIQLTAWVTMTASIIAQDVPEPDLILNYFKVYPLVMALSIGTLFVWFWGVGTRLQPLLPEGVSMKVVQFKVLFRIPLIYIAGIIALVGYFFSAFQTGGDTPSPLWFLLIVPLHLFSMFCIFYCMYFVAKTYKTIELQRETKFGDFVGEFFLIWFFFIGCWVLQPKINDWMENGAPEAPPEERTN